MEGPASAGPSASAPCVRGAEKAGGIERALTKRFAVCGEMKNLNPGNRVLGPRLSVLGCASPALAGQGPEDPGADVTVDRPYAADGTEEAFVQVLTPGGTLMYHEIPSGGPWQP